MQSVSIFLAGLLVAAAADLVAQHDTTEQAPRDAGRHVVGAPTSVFDNTGFWREGEAVRAAGRDYEVVFDRGEVVFVPVLGSRAPRTMPLRVRLQSIRRGTVVLHEAGSEMPATAWRGQRVAWPRGAGVEERYDVGVHGVEQSLEFATPLGGSGDLVARYSIDTLLESAVRADGSLAFALPGMGAVTYGTVTGIDAQGRRCAGRVRLDGRTLDLVLPHAFVADAAYPLVLDPLIGVEFDPLGGASGNSDTQPDVAYDASSNVYLVVWRRVFSSIDTGVRAQRLNSSGALVGGIMALTTNTSQKTHVRVCNVNLNNRFLVVWEESVLPVGPRDVRGVCVHAGSAATTAPIDLVGTADDEYAPCVMGVSTTADDEALLLWQDSGGIKVRQVLVGAAGDPAPVGGTTVLASGNVRHGTISKTDGSPGRAVAAWVDANGPDPEIVMRAMTRDGAPIGAVTFVSANNRPDDRPAVDGNGNRFMIVWERAETASPPFDIRARAVDVTSTTTTLVGVEQSLDPLAGQNQVRPDLCWLGEKFAVFWVRERDGFADEVEGYLVNPDCSVCGDRFFLDGLNGPGNYNYEFQPRCIGRFAGNPGNLDDGIVVFTEAQNVAPFDGNLVAQRFEQFGPGIAPVTVTPGCGAGGTPGSVDGPFVVGNPGFRFTLSGVSASAVVFFSIAFPGPALGCGSCALTNPLGFEFVLNGGGAANKPLPVPCSTSFAGVQFEVQWVTFNTAANPCPSAPGLSASARQRWTIGL